MRVFVNLYPPGRFLRPPGRPVPVCHAKFESTILRPTAVYFFEGYNLPLRCSRRELPFPPYLDDVSGRSSDRVFVIEMLDIILICRVLGPLPPTLTDTGREHGRRLVPCLLLSCFRFGNLLLSNLGDLFVVPRHVKVEAARYERQGEKNDDQQGSTGLRWGNAHGACCAHTSCPLEKPLDSVWYAITRLQHSTSATP